MFAFRLFFSHVNYSVSHFVFMSYLACHEIKKLKKIFCPISTFSLNCNQKHANF